jgi:sugar phosphate permease
LGNLRALQARAFSLTWLSYASYYLTRKNFSVVKSRLNEDLGISVAALGGIDTLYLGLYALGQFLTGSLGDRVGARQMIGLGMLATAAASVLFGFGSHAWVFGLAFGVNGLLQATGWPNNVKAMGAWFGRRSRGLVMGVWSTNYQLGGLLATAIATWLLTHYGWRSAFHVPAVWVALVGGAILMLLVEKPADRGLALPQEAEPTPQPAFTPEARSPFGEMIRLPELWILGGSYFFMKLIRYSLLFWLPFFLKRALGYDEGTAGYLSTTFEAGGIVGALLIGWIADRFFTHNPLRLAAAVIFVLAGSFLLLRLAGPLGIWAVGANLALIGFLLFGPDTLLCGAVAQNLGREHATGSAAGLINGFGSTGAALQGLITAAVSQAWGWNALFLFFVGFALISAAALLPLAWRKRF